MLIRRVWRGRRGAATIARGWWLAYGAAWLVGIVDVQARTVGALFVGSPNGSTLWRSLTASRDEGSPSWRPGQRSGEISEGMRWIPIVTALQVTVDMLGGEAAPAAFGHNDGDVVTGWREVAGDAGLDEAAVERIQRVIESYAPIQPADR